MGEDNGDYTPPAIWAQVEASTRQALTEAASEDNAYRTKALEGQLKSAQAARENAMKIAQLQASTSRYGIDAQSATAMRALKENARQFDAQHGLEIAKAYTAFASTPDLMWAKDDFLTGMSRVGQGLNPASIASQPAPHAKTWQDFDALTQYRGQSASGAAAASNGGATAAGAGAAAGGGTGEAKDPRLTAAGAIMKALPPSATPGADGQDWNAINAIVEMYKSGHPGIGRLTESQQKTGLAATARAGYDPNRVREDWMRGLPGQKSPVLAA